MIARYGIAVDQTTHGGRLHVSRAEGINDRMGLTLCGLPCYVTRSVEFPYWGWRVDCYDCAEKIVGPDLLAHAEHMPEGAMF